MVCLKYKPHSFLHFQFWNFVEPLALGAMHIFNTYFQNRKCQLELIANISITKHQYYLKSFFIWFTVKAWFHSPKPFQKCCMFHMQGQLDRHKLEVSMSEWENGVGRKGLNLLDARKLFGISRIRTKETAFTCPEKEPDCWYWKSRKKQKLNPGGKLLGDEMFLIQDGS